MIKEIEINECIEEGYDHRVKVSLTNTAGIMKINIHNGRIGLSASVDPHDIMEAYSVLKGEED